MTQASAAMRSADYWS